MDGGGRAAASGGVTGEQAGGVSPHRRDGGEAVGVHFFG